MKLIMVFLVALSLTFTPIASFAKPGGKGKAKDPQPNESAYEHSSEKARFKRGDDNQEDQGVFLRGKDDDSDVLKDGNKKKNKQRKNSDIDDVATDEVQTKGKKAKKTKDEVKTKSKKVEKTTDDSEGVVEERTKEQKKERIDRSERDQERKARKLERKAKKNKRKDIED